MMRGGVRGGRGGHVRYGGGRGGTREKVVGIMVSVVEVKQRRLFRP